ncbi:hypothetical protein Hanom_Chr09g00805401 [Helianthus anomalus]
MHWALTGLRLIMGSANRLKLDETTCFVGWSMTKRTPVSSNWFMANRFDSSGP